MKTIVSIFLALVIPSGLLGSADSAKTSRKHPRMSRFAEKYGGNIVLRTSFEWHTTPLDYEGEPQFLKISLFPGGPIPYTEEILVDTTWQVFGRSLTETQVQGSGAFHQFDPEGLRELRAAFSALPASADVERLDHLICISFESPASPGVWISKAYDKTNPPEPLLKIATFLKKFKCTYFASHPGYLWPDVARAEDLARKRREADRKRREVQWIRDLKHEDAQRMRTGR